MSISMTPVSDDERVVPLADLFRLLGDATRLRIVRAEREGKQVFYAAADAHISAMLAGMLEHVAEPSTQWQEGA